MANEARENNYSIQFLRFIFAIVMCFGHALAVTMLAAYSQYDVLKYSIKGCFVSLYFFFVMSGFFLPKALKRSLEEFILDRIIRLWPVLAFSIFITALFRPLKLLNVSFTGYDFATLLFLQGVGVSQEPGLNGVAWFVCVLFWLSIIYLVIIKIIKNNLVNTIIILLIVFISASIYYNSLGITVRGVVHGFMPIFVLNGLFTIGFGVLINQLNKMLNKKNNKWLFYDTTTPFLKIFFSLSEISILLFILVYVCFMGVEIHPLLSITTIILFSILLLLFYNKSGFLSAHLLNKPSLDFLGKSSYSIYIMQPVTFCIINAMAYNTTGVLTNNVSIVLVSVMLLYILWGLIAYFLVEKPVQALYKNIKRKNNEQN